MFDLIERFLNEVVCIRSVANKQAGGVGRSSSTKRTKEKPTINYTRMNQSKNKNEAWKIWGSEGYFLID